MNQTEWLKRKIEFEEWSRIMLEHARKKGASDAEVSFSLDAGLSVNVRMGIVDTLEFNRDKGFGVTVYFGERKGSATTSDLAMGALDETLEAACQIAKFAAPDPVSSFPDREDQAFEHQDLDLDHPWSIEASGAIAMAKACEEEARAVDPRISNSEGASVHSYRGLHVYSNTNGFLGGYLGTRHSMSCSLVAKSGDEMQRDDWYTVSRRSEDLDPISLIAQKTAERALSRLGARKIKTQKAPVIFSADMARGLLGTFISAIRGGALYRKSSFLVDHLGRPVFPTWVEIDETPHILRALGSAPYDAEGVKTAYKKIVAQGTLESYILSTYSARRLGMKTTGNAGGVYNVQIHPNVSGGLEALIKGMKRGLWVTELMGNGANLITGDYSRGASGFWIENGEVQYPVEEITIAGRLQDLFSGLQAVASDCDRRGSVWTGSWLLPDMMIAGA